MIIAFTGAGISKESGIPTFEDMGNLREKLRRSFATQHPDEYDQIVGNLINTCSKAEPNNAHLALAKYAIPVLTMNIDGLHQKAGSKNVIELHGNPKTGIVLYGDPAPNYQIAYDWVENLLPGDIFLVIGASRYTNFSAMIRVLAKSSGARVVEIQKEASKNVEAFLYNHRDKIESFEDFVKRAE